MTMHIDPPLAAALERIAAPEAVCYCPCAGRDVALALDALGQHLGHFVFCDKGYRRPHLTGRHAVPEAWRRLHGSRPAQGPAARPQDPQTLTENTETWRRPNGSLVTLEFHAARAEDLLVKRFGPRSITAFLHINDGQGEGGSDLWFLGTDGHARVTGSPCLLPAVAERLADESLVITDGALTDPEFRDGAPFRRCGLLWEPVNPLANNRSPDRRVTVWRATREGAT